MSNNQEANISTSQQQQEQQPLQMAVTDRPSFAPISDRRGGPMDIGEPMQDIQQQVPQQQQQQPSMMFSTSAGNETLHQQQQQPPSQQQMDGATDASVQCDPRLLMHPLQPQISNQSTQSNQSFQSFESVDSQQQQQQQNSGGGFSGGGMAPSQPQKQQQPQQTHHQPQQQQPFPNPPQATTSSSLTSASGHLASPPQHGHEKSKSRRWSITGRFFEKRKSITEPFHVPGAPPSSAFSSSYKSINSNIVGADAGADGKGCSWGEPESSFGGRANGGGGNHNTSGSYQQHQGHYNQQTNNNSNMAATNNSSSSSSSSSSAASNNNGSSATDSKSTSPPGSNGSSRRSSLADLPKAILSSLRRGSLVGPCDAGSVMAAASAASMAGGGALGGGAEGGVGAIAEDGEDLDEDGGPKVLMAVPKAPPRDPHISRPPLKSILKKQPSEANPSSAASATAAAGANADTDTCPSEDAPAMSTSTAAAAAGANPTANVNGDIDHDQMMSSDTVHPMATADMDTKDINLLTPTDHRARLLIRSPTPNHPQQHLVNNNNGNNPMLMGGAGSPLPSNNSDSVTNSNNGGLDKMESSLSSQGAALPPDFTPGVQPNSYHKGWGGERGQVSVGDYISQDELLTQQMVGISSRAQDLANQYYSKTSQNSQTARSLAPVASAASGAGGLRKSINFLETVEIIPAHRKSDYNRQSDKHATFRILTPDMKSEIRDELNTYKMREMAVHVESMANTAFH